MEPKQLADAMASFMLRYKASWKVKFIPLRACLLRYFEDSCILAEDLVETDSEKMGVIGQEIAQTMKEDQNVAAKTGLIHAVQRFLVTLEASKPGY